MATQTKHAVALEDVLKTIPLKRRRELREQIELLCSLIKLENTFMESRCRLRSGASSQSAQHKIRETNALKRLHMPRYWVDGPNYPMPRACTLSQAAELMHVTEGSLKVRVSLHRQYQKWVEYSIASGRGDPPGFIICTKMNQDELDEQLKIFNETIKNSTSKTNEVQFNASTAQ